MQDFVQISKENDNLDINKVKKLEISNKIIKKYVDVTKTDIQFAVIWNRIFWLTNACSINQFKTTSGSQDIWKCIHLISSRKSFQYWSRKINLHKEKINIEYAKAELRYFYDFTCMIMYIFWAIWRNLWFHVKEIAKAVCILFAANLLTREYYPKR